MSDESRTCRVKVLIDEITGLTPAGESEPRPLIKGMVVTLWKEQVHHLNAGDVPAVEILED